MAEQPTSDWSKSLDAVRITFANVTAFQTWVKKPDATTAKEKIYLHSRVKSGLTWPHLIVIQRSLSFKTQTEGFIEDQSCELLFEAINKETAGTPDEFYALTNPVGDIIQGMMELAGVANTFGYIDDPNCQLLTPPHWSTEGEVGEIGQSASKVQVMSTRWLLTWV